MKTKKIVDRQELAREKRNKKLAQGIHDAVKFFDLEATFRTFLLDNIYKAYMPSDEELGVRIQNKINDVIETSATLSFASEKTIERIVEKRITELGKKYENKIKDEVIGAIRERLKDFYYDD